MTEYLEAKQAGEELEWADGNITWVRHDTYMTKAEADKAAGTLKEQGYQTDVDWISRKWKQTDAYWKGTKNYVVYRSKEQEQPVQHEGMPYFECQACGAKIYAVREPVFCPKCKAKPFVTAKHGHEPEILELEAKEYRVSPMDNPIRFLGNMLAGESHDTGEKQTEYNIPHEVGTPDSASSAKDQPPVHDGEEEGRGNEAAV